MAERAVFRRSSRRRKRLSRQRLLVNGTWRMAYEARGRINDAYQSEEAAVESTIKEDIQRKQQQQQQKSAKIETVDALESSRGGGSLARDASQPPSLSLHHHHHLDNVDLEELPPEGGFSSGSAGERTGERVGGFPDPATNEERAALAEEQRCNQARLYDQEACTDMSSGSAAAGGGEGHSAGYPTSTIITPLPTPTSISTQPSSASTWSLPCKFNGAKQHRKSHHRQQQQQQQQAPGLDVEADSERQRRARCFYRYRNLHPRAVAYLFARRHGEESNDDSNAVNNTSTATTTTTAVVARRVCYPADRGRSGSSSGGGGGNGGGGRGRRVGERNEGLVPTAYVNYSPSTNNNNNNHNHHHHHVNNANVTNATTATTTTTLPNNNNNNENSTVLSAELLPDLLNSHIPPPPPYSTLPPPSSGGRVRGSSGASAGVIGLPLPPVPPSSSPPRRPSFLAPGLSLIGGGRRGRGPRRSAGSHYTPDDEPKHCCGVVVSQAVSIRWFILMIAFVGLCCAVVGTVLGALKTTGREHLTVSLLMIGVGIVLITVSGIAWRLTSTDAPSCRMMLGFHTDDTEPNRRFVPRVPPSYGRSHHPYAAMMYPEFQYRPPPPSYQASMQEYRLRLLLLDRQHAPSTPALSPVSPPPTYRSHISGRPPLTFSRESDYSHPPSYRSRSSSVMPRPTVDSQTGATTEGETAASGTHSRDPSLSLSCLSHESLFELSEGNGARETRRSRLEVTGNGNLDGTIRETECIVHSSMGSDGANYGNKNWTSDYPDKTMEDGDVRNNQLPHPVWKNRDSNLVTIVQTTNSTQVLNQDAVVVTVSGQNSNSLPLGVQGEVEILAHL